MAMATKTVSIAIASCLFLALYAGAVVEDHVDRGGDFCRVDGDGTETCGPVPFDSDGDDDQEDEGWEEEEGEEEKEDDDDDDKDDDDDDGEEEEEEEEEWTSSDDGGDDDDPWRAAPGAEGEEGGDCVDLHDDCASLAAQAGSVEAWCATKNPGFATHRCASTCGTCADPAVAAALAAWRRDGADDAPPCTDDDPECAEWAAMGECGFNPGFMTEECRRSCLVCFEDT